MLNVDFGKTALAARNAAQKRKEDNAEFLKEHLEELAGGCDAVIAEVTPDTLAEGSEYFEFSKDEYRLIKFKDVAFGKEKAAAEKEYVKISGTCFYYCDFESCGFNNIVFSDCRFVGCNFNGCYTLGLTAAFRGCGFSSRNPDEISIEDMPSTFTGCEFSARFENCDLSHAVLDKCNFYFSLFIDINMYDAIFVDCSIDTTRFAGCDLRNARIINPKFIEFHIEDTSRKTTVDRNTFLGRINYGRKEKREVKHAAEVYSRFSELFENAKIMDLNGEYFYLGKVTEQRVLTGYARLKSALGLITCGYGERPFFSLLCALVVILLCGTLYMFFGVSYNNETLVFHPFAGEPFPPLGKLVLWYHFSLVTFSTVGYGNVTPIGGSLAVSAVEMVLGVIMVGIWVSTLVRKMVR